MKRDFSPTQIFTAVILLCALVSGCRHSPVPRLYLLRPQPLPADGTAEQEAQKPLIVLRPVAIAEYLSRPQIVIRRGEREVAHAEFDRWAEPLTTQAFSYLTDTLAADLQDFKVKPFPWHGAAMPLYEIAISVRALDGTPGDAVRLRADWSIVRPGRTPIIIQEGRSDLQAQCAEPGIPGVVAATAELLDILSQTIAAAVKKQPATLHE